MFSPFFVFVFSIFVAHAPAELQPSTPAPAWMNDGTIKAMAAPQRCTVEDCTCQVSRGAVAPAAISQIARADRHNVYFLEDEYSLEADQRSSIQAFISKYPRSSSVDITLVGYADGCGDATENHTLSSTRARVVTDEIKRALPNARISYNGAGEVSVDHDPRSRRVDILVRTKSNIEISIEKVRADVYLIDASGSLWSDWGSWKSIINASFQPGSRIYVSKMHGCRSGMSLDAIRPSGGTEIWWSYWTVLDDMSPGETLAIISDFDSNYPLLDWEHRALEKKVREKGVRVIVIQL